MITLQKTHEKINGLQAVELDLFDNAFFRELDRTMRVDAEERAELRNTYLKLFNLVSVTVMSHIDLQENPNAVASFFYHNLDFYLKKAIVNYAWEMHYNGTSLDKNQYFTHIRKHNIGIHIYGDENDNVYVVCGCTVDPEDNGKDYVEFIKDDLVFVFENERSLLYTGIDPFSALGRVLMYDHKDTLRKNAGSLVEFFKKLLTAFPALDYYCYCFNTRRFHAEVEDEVRKNDADFSHGEDTLVFRSTTIDLEGQWVDDEFRRYGYPGHYAYLKALEHDILGYCNNMLPIQCREEYRICDFPPSSTKMFNNFDVGMPSRIDK